MPLENRIWHMHEIILYEGKDRPLRTLMIKI